jgi:hypothetical protein
VSTSVLRRSAIAAAVAVTALAGTSVARADFSTGNQNPELQVSVGLVSNNIDPNIAKTGDLVRLSMSLKNVGPKQWVHVYLIPSVPFADLAAYDFLVEMNSGQRHALSLPIKIRKFIPSGVYSLTMLAFGDASIDASAATASITVANG